MATYEQVIDGLEILRRYDDKEHGIAVEHDTIYAGPTGGLDQTAEEVVSAEDRARLEELGWFYAEDYDCWQTFV